MANVIFIGGCLILDIDKETGHYRFPSQHIGRCCFCGGDTLAGHCKYCSQIYADNKEMVAKRVEQLYPGSNIEIDMYTCILFVEVLSLYGSEQLMTKEEAETAMRERITEVREKQAAKERREREKREEKERLERQKQHNKETWPKLMNQLNF